jgi:transketolase
MALAGKLDKKAYRVFVIMGDGETDEGQIWEAGRAASHFKLDNLIGIIDRNGLQIDGATEEIMKLEPIRKRWKSLGWKTIEIDGHQMRQILDAFHWVNRIREKPALIIAHTLKGKGVSFMQGTLSFHGKPPSKEQYEKAMSELNSAEEALKSEELNNG